MFLSLRKRYYAFLLLRRYNLRYSTFIRIGKGVYVEYWSGKREICVNLLDPLFWETFCHELGHHIYSSTEYKEIKNSKLWFEDSMIFGDDGCSSYRARLHEEAVATVVGVRVSRLFGIECNKAEMLKWFNTYTGGGYTWITLNSMTPEELTPLVHKLTKKINKA